MAFTRVSVWCPWSEVSQPRSRDSPGPSVSRISSCFVTPERVIVRRTVTSTFRSSLFRIIHPPLAGVACSQEEAVLLSSHNFTEAFVLLRGFCVGKAARAGNSTTQAAIDRYIMRPLATTHGTDFA